MKIVHIVVLLFVAFLLAGCNSVKKQPEIVSQTPEVPVAQLGQEPEPELKLVWNEDWQPKVFFAFDSADLDIYSEKSLGGVLAFMMMNTDVKITIEGHADRIGSSEYNQKLSERRAEAVKNHLVSHGIAAARISTYGHGEEDVLECKQKSKRALILCLQPARNATLKSVQ